MRTEFALGALEMALGRRRPARGLLHHSDRGSQYTADEYRELLKRRGLVASRSRKGNCWDTAIERFFGSLKSEWTDGQRYATREQARRDVIHYIEIEYNSERFHSTVGYRRPREIELDTVA